MFFYLTGEKFVLAAALALLLANFTAGSVFATTPTPNVTPTPIQIVIEEKIRVGEGNPATSGEVVDEQVSVVDEVRTSGEVIDESVTVVDEVRTSGEVVDEQVSVVDEVRTSGEVIDESVTVVDEVEVDAVSSGESEEDEDAGDQVDAVSSGESEADGDAGEHEDAVSSGESEEDEDLGEHEDLRESSQSAERQDQGSTRFGECGLNAGGAASTGQVGLIMAPIFLYAWRRVEKH